MVLTTTVSLELVSRLSLRLLYHPFSPALFRLRHQCCLQYTLHINALLLPRPLQNPHPQMPHRRQTRFHNWPFHNLYPAVPPPPSPPPGEVMSTSHPRSAVVYAPSASVSPGGESRPDPSQSTGTRPTTLTCRGSPPEPPQCKILPSSAHPPPPVHTPTADAPIYAVLSASSESLLFSHHMTPTGPALVT